MTPAHHREPPMTYDALDALPLYRYRIDATFDRALAIPSQQRAALWRGAFGAVLRSLVCHDGALQCAQCSLLASCPYARVFAPRIPAGRPLIARLNDPPRPFMLTDPRPDADVLPPGVKLGIGLTVAGVVVDEVLHLLVTLRKMGEIGLGRYQVRFVAESMRALDASGLAVQEVWKRGSEGVCAHRAPLRARDLMRPGDDQARRIRVRFVTPADIREKDASDAAPRFGALIRRSRDRIGALATFFGHGSIAHDPRALGTLADTVATVSAEVTASEVARHSSRTGQWHPIGGVVGTVVYEGEAIAQTMPWLRVAELVGVGKHATFGNGRLVVDVLG